MSEVTSGALVAVQSPKWGGPGQATERDRAQGLPGAGDVGQREAARNHRACIEPGSCAVIRAGMGGGVGALLKDTLRTGDFILEQEVLKCWEEGRYLKKG